MTVVEVDCKKSMVVIVVNLLLPTFLGSWAGGGKFMVVVVADGRDTYLQQLDLPEWLITKITYPLPLQMTNTQGKGEKEGRGEKGGKGERERKTTRD